jgi:hypothetical protein
LTKAVKFVGTLPGQGCGIPYDGDNEGHGSLQAIELSKNGQFPGWLQKTKPDVVMVHFGTNDVVIMGLCSLIIAIVN